MFNQVCTPATSRRLKESGFPQPEPAPGQVWYTANNEQFICIRDQGSHFTIAWIKTGGMGELRKGALASCVYAPSDADILRELGNDYHIGVLNGVFVAGLHQFGQSDLQFNENPAEACAMAWEAKNQKR
jgi:hypothetical protein